MNEAFVENETLRELSVEKMGDNRILIIADAGMALQSDYSKGLYPDTIFLPFPRASLKQTLNLILALMKHGKEFKFWPQLFLIAGAIDEVLERREVMSVAGEEDSLIDVDVPLIVSYAKLIKEIQEKVRSGEIPKTVLVAPPGLNNYYPRINRLMRTVTAMVRENGGHMILTGAEFPRFVEPNPGNPSDLSAPAAWRFLSEISLGLPSIDEEHCIEITQADRQNFDSYEIYEFLMNQLGAEETVCEAPPADSPDRAGPQMIRMTQSSDDMSIWSNSFFEKAREIEEKHPHNVRREAVRLSGRFGSKCMKPCGTWPEPEFVVDKPGEENPSLEELRTYMRCSRQ